MMTGYTLTEIYGRGHGLALNPVETELVDDDDQEGALSRTVTAVSHRSHLDLPMIVAHKSVKADIEEELAETREVDHRIAVVM